MIRPTMQEVGRGSGGDSGAAPARSRCIAVELLHVADAHIRDLADLATRYRVPGLTEDLDELAATLAGRVLDAFVDVPR